MNNLAPIQDALTLAYQQLERLCILSLLLQGGGDSAFPEPQKTELYAWIFAMAHEAQERIDEAVGAVIEIGGSCHE